MMHRVCCLYGKTTSNSISLVETHGVGARHTCSHRRSDQRQPHYHKEKSSCCLHLLSLHRSHRKEADYLLSLRHLLQINQVSWNSEVHNAHHMHARTQRTSATGATHGAHRHACVQDRSPPLLDIYRLRMLHLEAPRARTLS